ncbi:MAG: sodium:solute symporter, partial [Paludibacter sp.]|nr:sodium:solute symporter [Paludibacter sp.]
MSPILILLTIVLYFAILFGVSYLSGRKADNAGFFSGNRKSPWYVVAFATIGAAISGVTFVSVPGMVAASGFSYLQMVLGFAVGQLIIAFVLIPLFYKMNLVSIYE